MLGLCRILHLIHDLRCTGGGCQNTIKAEKGKFWKWLRRKDRNCGVNKTYDISRGCHFTSKCTGVNQLINQSNLFVLHISAMWQFKVLFIVKWSQALKVRNIKDCSSPADYPFMPIEQFRRAHVQKGTGAVASGSKAWPVGHKPLFYKFGRLTNHKL